MTNDIKIKQVAKELGMYEETLRYKIVYSNRWSAKDKEILLKYGGSDKFREDYLSQLDLKKKSVVLRRKICKLLFLSDGSAFDKMKNVRRHFNQDEIDILCKKLTKEEKIVLNYMMHKNKERKINYGREGLPMPSGQGSR